MLFMASSENFSESFMSEAQQNNDTLQLLLFVDNRHSSEKNIEQIREYLGNLSKDYKFQLQVLEISECPHLVEHFKLVATPALVKVNPPPQQTLAGTNLTAKLKKYWYQWQTTLKENNDIFQNYLDKDSLLHTCLPSSELIRLKDDIFHLKKEVKQLQQQIKFKDQMLSMLAHDLRSPLTAASIAVETIELAQNQENYKEKETLRKKLIKQAKNQFLIMNNMINDLLQASKVINNQFNVVPTPINLLSLTDDILENMQPKLQEKKQVLIKEFPQNLPLVYADSKLITQVIINLIDNASKYSPDSASIILSIVHKTTQKIQVSIIDTGSGIPDMEKHRIFDDHFRLKRDRKQDGYGIGLSLCRQIINAHYGHIWVDNNGTKGSCFRFTLPVYR